MKLLQAVKLRQKFLAITGIAFLLPLTFHAAFMGMCLVSIGEIERWTLSDEILEVESLFRKHMGHLERVANFIRAKTSEGGIASSHIFPATQDPLLQDWLKEVSGLDFVVLQEGDQVIPLFIREPLSGRDPLVNSIKEILYSQSTSSLGSGFIRIQNKTYLVRLSPGADPASGIRILVGMNMEDDLLSPFSPAEQENFMVTEIPQTEVSTRAESIWVTNDTKGNATIHRALPGSIPGTLFDLQYTSQEGLFDQLRTRLVWFPAFLLGAVLISSLLGTAWATTLVLRPLNRMAQTMAAVAGPEDYITRIPEDNTDEIGDLAASFNRLMARLEEAQRDLEMAQKAKVEAEKLAILHATVITLAHQINNSLAALVGQAELLLLGGKTSVKMRKSLEVIRDMGLRIAEVIKQLQFADTVHTTAYLTTQDMLHIELKEAEEQDTDPVQAS